MKLMLELLENEENLEILLAQRPLPSSCAQVDPFSTVVIFGLGAVGLAVIQGCKALNCCKIVGVDTNPKKFDIATQRLF